MIHISCPGCKQHLTLPNQLAGSNKLLVCPKCGFKGGIDSYGKLNLSTTPINSPNENEHTQIGGRNFRQSTNIGCLQGLNGTKYQLISGQNRFGRKSTQSTCQHQINNDDKYLSRNHFSIDVIFNKTVLRFDHRLTDMGSTNGTKVNGIKLDKGDILLLKEGDKIIAGKTEFVFELVALQDDTQIAH